MRLRTASSIDTRHWVVPKNDWSTPPCELRQRLLKSCSAPSYYYWVIKEHSDVELFCGITPLCARPTRETFRGIYAGPGNRRGTRRPARAFEKLLQGIAVVGGTQEY